MRHINGNIHVKSLHSGVVGDSASRRQEVQMHKRTDGRRLDERRRWKERRGGRKSEGDSGEVDHKKDKHEEGGGGDAV